MATVEERLKDAPHRLTIVAACGVARRVEHLLTDQRLRDALETAELFADGLATEAQVSTAQRAAGAAIESAREGWAIRAEWAVQKAIAAAAEPAQAAWATRAAETVTAAWEAGARTGVETEIDLILDCLLPPHIPFLFPAHVKALATTTYEKRDWLLMPVLADALEEIGQDEMAAHCRQPIHAKGCYVLDAILDQRFL